MSRDYDPSVSEHLYRSRIVYLSGDITTSLADHGISHLLVLDNLARPAALNTYISTSGGPVTGNAREWCVRPVNGSWIGMPLERASSSSSAAESNDARTELR